MGGTLAWHARHAAVTIAVERVDDRRAAEATLGAEVLGAQVELIDRHGERNCVDLLRRLKPEILIVHPRNDMHHDHRRVAEKPSRPRFERYRLIEASRWNIL